MTEDYCNGYYDALNDVYEYIIERKSNRDNLHTRGEIEDKVYIMRKKAGEEVERF